MAALTRRGLLVLALCGGAATVTVATLLRKPADFAVATPRLGPAEATELRSLEALVVTDPPKPMPALGFQDSSGGRHDLREYLGRPVVLNLWATWCQPCVAELPALAALAHSQGPEGVAVVALSVDRGGASIVQQFLVAHAIDLPVRVDPQGAATDTLGVRGLPTTLLIDRQGRERARFEGAADWASQTALASILRATA